MSSRWPLPGLVLLSFGVLIMSTVAFAACGGELTGQIVPPYPPGLRDLGGSCLSESDDYSRVCDYSIGLLADTAPAEEDSEPVIRHIIAGRMVGRDGQHARWLITDVLPYPQVDPDQHLQLGSCRRLGEEDPALAVVVPNHSEQAYLAPATWVRRLQLSTGKFVALDTAGVDCVNEAYSAP